MLSCMGYRIDTGNLSPSGIDHLVGDRLKGSPA